MIGTTALSWLRTQRWWIHLLMAVAFAATEVAFLLLGVLIVPHAVQTGVFSGGGPAVAVEPRHQSPLSTSSAVQRSQPSEALRAHDPSGAPAISSTTLASVTTATVTNAHPTFTSQSNEPPPARSSRLPQDSIIHAPLPLESEKVALGLSDGRIEPAVERRLVPLPVGQSTISASTRVGEWRAVGASPPYRTLGNDWTTIESQGFEGFFPPAGGLWQAFDNDGATNGELYWDDTSAKADVGSWSAWSAAGGANRRDPVAGQQYANFMKAWLVYGPFSLADAEAAELTFRYWNKSEANFDHFKWMASSDGTNFTGYQTSGNQSSWRSETLNLASVPGGSLIGDSSVWIAFIFTSDSSFTDLGTFIDQIVVRKRLKPTTGSLTVTVNNVAGGNTDVPGATGEVELFTSGGTRVATKPTSRTGPGVGQAVFADLSPGRYVFNVYQSGPQGREDWGVSSHFDVVAGSNSQSFTRNRPYVTNIQLKRDANGAGIALGERLDPGTWVRAELTIKNPASFTASNVSGELRLDRTGDGTADDAASTETSDLVSGSERTFTARSKVDAIGDYRRALTARYSNLTILSDGWAWANAFTVAWPPNSPPTLTNGSVTPPTGHRSTNFHYEVTYTDADGDWPSKMQVEIPTVGTFDMEKKYGWDFWVTDGVDYVYDRTLPLGTHSATFRFNDGKNNHADVTYAVAGPTVSNQNPTAPTGPSPADGATDVNPTSLMLDWANASDPDGDAVSYQLRYRIAGGSFGSWIDAPTSSYAIPAPLLEEKSYDWQVRSVDSLGAIADGDLWRFTTKRLHGTVTLSVCNVSWSNAADVPGNQGIVRLYQGSTLVGSATTTKTSARCGSATVDPVNPSSDGYVAKVYYPGPFGEESWGETGSISVGDGEDVTRSFTRRRPVGQDVAFYRDASHTQPLAANDTVEVGATVYASVIVENPMSVTASPTVTLRVDRNNTAPFDHDLSQTILAIPAGQTGSASLSFTVGIAGTYARSILVTTSGVLTDSWAWGSTFIAGSRPVITNANPSATTVTVQKGDQQAFSMSYADADNDVTQLRWFLDGIQQAESGSAFSYTAPGQAGSHTLSVRVTDQLGLSAERSWSIVVPANKPPSLTIAISDVDNRIKRIAFTTSDYENLATTISIYVDNNYKTGIPNVPPTSPFSSSWDWVASSDEVLAGDHVVRVEVTDGENTTTESQTVRFTPAYGVSLVDLRQQWVALRHDSVYQTAYGQVRTVPGATNSSGFEGATTITVRNDGNTRVTYELTPGQQTLFARGDAYQGEVPLTSPWTVGVAPYSWGPQYANRATVTVEPHAEGSFLLRPSVPASEELDETVIVQFTLKSADTAHPEDRIATTQSDVVYRTVTLPTYNDADLANFFTSLQQLGTSAWNFFIGDDWAQLNDDEASVFERAFAAGMLVSNVALVGDVKVAVKGAFAGGRKITGEVTASKLAPFLDDAAKGTSKGTLARTELKAAIRADVKGTLGTSDGKAWIRALTDDELELFGKRLMDGSFGLDTTRFERFVRATNSFKEAKNYSRFIELLQPATRPSMVDDVIFAAEQSKIVADDLVKNGYSVAERMTIEQPIKVGNVTRPVDLFIELGDAANPRYVLYELKNITITSVEKLKQDTNYIEQFRHYLTAIKEGSPGLGKVLTPKNARLEVVVSEFAPTTPATFNRELSLALGGAKTSVTRKSGGIAVVGLSPFAAAQITTNGGETIKTDNQLVALDGVCHDLSSGVEVNGSSAKVTFSETAQSWRYESTESQGTHVYEVRCVDEGGSLSEADTITVLVDPPPVITTNGGRDFATSSQSIVLDGTAETFFSQVLVNGSSQFVTFDQSTGAWHYVNTMSSEGTYPFAVTAKTSSGAESDPASIRVTYDATVPTVSASPGGGTYTTPPSVTLTASERSAIFYTTDGSVPTPSSTRYTDPIVIDRTTALSFIAIDAAGNTSSVGRESYILLIPEQPPVTGIDYPSEITGKTGLISVRISGTKQAFETLVRREIGVGDRVIAEPGSKTWSYTTSVTVGEQAVIVGSPNVERLVTQAGGRSSSETVVRFLSTSAFSLSATPPGGRFTQPVVVTLAASQSITVTSAINDVAGASIVYAPPIEAIRYTTDGSTPSISSTTYTQPIAFDRTTTLTFLAVGMVGHVSPVATETFTIDQDTVPGLRWTVTPGDIAIGQPITLTLTNTGTAPLEYLNDPPYVITRDGVRIYPRAVSRGIGQLAAGQTKSWSWDQKDTNQLPVPAGSYQVRISLTRGDVSLSATATVLIGQPSP